MNSQPILIVGGGPSGLAAAQALASLGQRSILVEKESRLGGAPILSICPLRKQSRATWLNHLTWPFYL